MTGYKCVKCQSLFPHQAILLYAGRTGQSVGRLDCPVCGTRFTDGKLGQEYHGEIRPPSIRDCSWENPVTASPDDR
jgi:DNA-directed RNA polymerase subunit RPC12/RpoP